MYIGWLIGRSAMIDSGRTRSPGLTDTQYCDRPGQRLQPVHVIGHRQLRARPRAVVLVHVPRARAAARRGQQRARRCGARPGWSSTRSRRGRLARAVGIVEQVEGLVGVGRHDHRVEPLARAVRGPHRHAAPRRARRPTTGCPARTGRPAGPPRSGPRSASSRPGSSATGARCRSRSARGGRGSGAGSRSGSRGSGRLAVDQTADVIGTRKWRRKPGP